MGKTSFNIQLFLKFYRFKLLTFIEIRKVKICFFLRNIYIFIYYQFYLYKFVQFILFLNIKNKKINEKLVFIHISCFDE